MTLNDFLAKASSAETKLSVDVAGPTIIVNLTNKERKVFQVELEALIRFILFLSRNHERCHLAWENTGERKPSFTQYEEKSYRNIYACVENDEQLRSVFSISGNQTAPLTAAISRLIAFFAGKEYLGIHENTHFDAESARTAARNLPESLNLSAIAKSIGLALPNETFEAPLNPSGTKSHSHWIIPKPFLLLAGISGTGKTRFVRTQAALQGSVDDTYLLVPVRPDWSDPSDLFGYVSRIGGERFICTAVLRFMVRAWSDCIASADAEGYKLRPLDDIRTYWLCLDEMNLAPVEQYFADFLSVLETRQWSEGGYSSEPLLRINDLSQSVRQSLRESLGADCSEELWANISVQGLRLPPNVIVAGTVNMDESAHGFSRKVIDRALTIDFGAFFPSQFQNYFAPRTAPVELRFSRWSEVSASSDLSAAAADPQGSSSIQFLESVNDILRGTAFELAYRALNELLIAVRCFSPSDSRQLHAVWDDFLMWKVLPRIEGDAEKLRLREDGASVTSLLTMLLAYIQETFHLAAALNSNPARRPEILKRALDGSVPEVDFRSPHALARMQRRLEQHRFTSFWP